MSVREMTQFVTVLDNVPGALAEITRACAIAGINLEGFFQTIDASQTHGTVHFVTRNVDEARTTLVSLGKEFSEKQVLALQYADKPGVMAHVAQTLGDAGVNIEEVYVSTPGAAEETVLYVGVSGADLQRALEIAQQL